MVKNDALAGVSLVQTPQSQPIPGVAMVRNAAGGYVFAKDLETKAGDFLTLGTTGGTAYTGQYKLTTMNVDWLFEAIKGDGPRVVEMLTGISAEARAPKPDACLFALAACAAKGDPATVQAVKAAFPKVVRTTDHLAKFFGYWKNLAGKPKDGGGTAPVIGRAMRTAIGSFFTEGDVHDVAFRSLKARTRATPQGEAMALRDVLRITHPPAGTDLERKALLGWLAGKVEDDVARREVRDIDNFLLAQAAVTTDAALEVIRDRRVPWDFLPMEVLGDPEVWDALIDTIGLTALIRNLARMTRIRTLGPLAKVNDRVVARLTNAEALKRARIHPMDLWLALQTYKSGRSQPNPKADVQTWEPVPQITDALEQAFELSFGNVTPSGKRLLVAVDSSGSMGQGVYAGGSLLGTAYEVANTMAVMLARIEPQVHVIDADTTWHPSKVTAKTNLREIGAWRMPGGGTDMAVPYQWATGQKLNVDGIVIFTDNETWAGWNHPVQALNAYRAAVNPAVRSVCVSMTATGYSIQDPGDESVLQVAGLDASLPKVVSAWIR